MPNIRLALRTLFKSPFITMVAILSRALGIGANSAIFSLYDQMIMKSLPVPNPDEAQNWAWMDMPSLRAELTNRPDAYTFWFAACFDQVSSCLDAD